jgi:5,10-methenyltetrahydromethanopterin hydrogenase
VGGVGYTEATRGVGVDMVVVWGIAEVAYAAQGIAEVDEAHDEEVVKGWVVGSPEAAV